MSDQDTEYLTPDDDTKRLVRIETRLVKYQQQTMLHLLAVQDVVKELQEVVAELVEQRCGKETSHNDDNP